MMGSQTWQNPNVPPEVEENLSALFPGLSIEEALQHKESLYESLKRSYVNQTGRSSDNEPSSSVGHSWGESSVSGSGGEYDLAYDEALARSLQELDSDDEVEHVVVSGTVHSASGSIDNHAEGTSISETDQDEVDPDEMTYEELQSLAELIGRESKGLTERQISSLPFFKYKSGFFTKKLEIAPCCICITAYKNKESVTTLPCAHQYHSNCMAKGKQELPHLPIGGCINLSELKERFAHFTGNCCAFCIVSSCDSVCIFFRIFSSSLSWNGLPVYKWEITAEVN